VETITFKRRERVNKYKQGRNRAYNPMGMGRNNQKKMGEWRRRTVLSSMLIRQFWQASLSISIGHVLNPADTYMFPSWAKVTLTKDNPATIDLPNNTKTHSLFEIMPNSHKMVIVLSNCLQLIVLLAPADEFEAALKHPHSESFSAHNISIALFPTEDCLGRRQNGLRLFEKFAIWTSVITYFLSLTS
jgi:hypothetical protein